MAYRETPFDDRVDRYWSFVILGWALYTLFALWGVLADQNRLQALSNAGAVTAVLGIALGVYGWWRQRQLVDRLDGLGRGPRGDRSVIEGRIADETGTVVAPVVDDPRVSDRDTEEMSDLIGDVLGVDGSGREPDDGAVTRWYDASVFEHVWKTSSQYETVYEESKAATPFRVESLTETVDLTGAELSFLQGEREQFRSVTVDVENGEIQLAGIVDGILGTTDAEASRDAGGETTLTDDSPTAALLERAGADEESDRHLRDETYCVKGRCWAAADGERVHAVGTFERAPDGRVVPAGAVTVGRGRFEDRIDEEHERLERWRRRAKAAVVTLPVGLAVLVALTVGV